MAFTPADLIAIDADLKAFGAVESTTIADQTLRLRSLNDVLRLRSIMAADVAASTSTTGGSRTRYAAFDKGV